MPSNFTENYQLSQWSKDDQVRMEDFNADNAKTDAAIAAVSAKTFEERIYIGSYVGNGSGSRTIQLPWTPTLMLLLGAISSGTRVTYVISQDEFINVVESTPWDDTKGLTPLLRGSQLKIQSGNWCNNNGVTMKYVLFR